MIWQGEEVAEAGAEVGVEAAGVAVRANDRI